MEVIQCVLTVVQRVCARHERILVPSVTLDVCCQLEYLCCVGRHKQQIAIVIVCHDSTIT